MREVPSVTERPLGKIPTTTVTNEHARAIQAMAPIILGGQVLPPRVASQPETLTAPQYQGMVYIGIVANQAGWAFVPATTSV